MKKPFYIKLHYICSIVLLLALLSSTCCLLASAEFKRDYSVTVDNPGGGVATGMPVIIKDIKHGSAPNLNLAGWIKSNYTMQYYEYTIDGGVNWIRDDDAIIARPDVKSYCPNTYQTAGFDVDIDVSQLPRGEYDIFLRGYTNKGAIIEVLALLNVQIGKTDTHTTTYTDINLKAFDFQTGKMILQADQPVLLGAYNLRNYQYAEIVMDQNTTLTLSSGKNSAISFLASTEASVSNDGGSYTATIDLSNVQYAGDLYLDSQADVGISRIRLYTNVPDYYTGELVVHMTPTPYEYLSGANQVDATLMSDDTVGTYISLFPTNNTNDPYIYFSLNKYLKDTQDVQVSADYYRYAVITLQTFESNSRGLFRLFLCAGEIRGPHGESHVAFQPINDGEWHTYVIPLCEEEYWTGAIYGMRFDFIDGNATVSDCANIASLGFYPDEQSAKEAAAQPLSVYHEEGNIPGNPYEEENRAPSGKADAITWFDDSLTDCFGGANKANYQFDEYGHLILQATETTNDPFISFSMRTYAALTEQPLLRAEDYGVVVLRVYGEKKISGKNFMLYYYAGGFDYAQGTRAVSAFFEGDEWEYLVYDMSKAEYWTDEILGFRLDFSNQINLGQRVCLSDILFFKDMEAWKAYQIENGIQIGDQVDTESTTQDTQPETEIPTIEIPTQGPGLEYVEPETEPSQQSSTGCKSIVNASVILTLLGCAIVAFRKRDRYV